MITTYQLYLPGQDQPVSTQTVDWPKAPKGKQLRRLIESLLAGGGIEHVRVFWQGVYTSMFVDGMSSVHGLPVNAKATEIYHNNVRIHDPSRYAAQKARGDMPSIHGPAILFDRDVWS